MKRDNFSEAELGDLLQDTIRRVMRAAVTVEGTIAAVDDQAFTCDVTIGDSYGSTIYYGVPLKVLSGSQASVVEVPKTGSECIICFREANLGRPQLLACHSSLNLLVNSDNIVFHGGQLGGMVKVVDLVSKLNALENDLNTLKQMFSSWSPVPQDGGAALKAATGSWTGQQVKITNREDLENKSITQ